MIGALLLALSENDAIAAPDICGFVDEKKDAFKEGESRIATPDGQLTLLPNVVVLVLGVGINGKDSRVFPIETPVEYALADGGRITVYTGMQADPVYVAASGLMPEQTGWALAFPLTVQAVHAFANSPPIAARMGDRGTIEYTAIEQEQLQRAYACVANRYPLTTGGDQLQASDPDSLAGLENDGAEAVEPASKKPRLAAPLLVAAVGAGLVGATYGPWATGAADPGIGAWRAMQGLNLLGGVTLVAGAGWTVGALMGKGKSADIVVRVTPTGASVAGRF